jgi:SAM-dependent methyltransferase
MRHDWERRATADPLYYIDSTREGWTLEEFYDRGLDLVSQIVDPVLAALDVDPSGKRVLEIGCGVGRLFSGLSKRFAEVSGIDVSPTMVAIGKEHCPVDATWVVGDGCSLSGIEDRSVDHVLSFEVLQHVPRQCVIASYLAETRRVLRPGGIFQLQMRSGSDSRTQGAIRALPRPGRVVAARMLEKLGALRLDGDIDTWLGCIAPPGQTADWARQLGFVGVRVLADDLHAPGMGYWLVGRVPSEAR